MVDVNVQPFEIETTSRHGDVIRADVYLPKGARRDRAPVLLGVSPYQKVLRPLLVRPSGTEPMRPSIRPIRRPVGPKGYTDYPPLSG